MKTNNTFQRHHSAFLTPFVKHEIDILRISCYAICAMQDVPDRRRLVLAAVFQEDGVKFGVIDNGGHFESANFVDTGVEQVIQLPFDIRAALLAPLSRAALPPPCRCEALAKPL